MGTMMRTLLLTHPAERSPSTRMKIPMTPSTATCTTSWSGSRGPKAKNMRTSWLHRTTEPVIRQGNSLWNVQLRRTYHKQGADDCYESYDRVCMSKVEYGGKCLVLTRDEENKEDL